MPVRRLPAVVALAATALLALTSCTAGGPAAAAASPPRSTPAVDPEPSADCGKAELPAGHRMVELVNPPAQGIVQARTAAFSCDPNGGGYAGRGTARDYTFAPDVVARLATGATTHRTVSFDALSGHLRACLGQQGSVQQPFSCSGNIYDITLSASGSVTRISEVWHS